MDSVVALPSRDELRRFVRQVLCDHDRLDPGQTPIYEAILKQRGKPCGLYIEAQGPRLLRSHAIWVGDEHKLLFYDSTGSRFADIRLSEAPDPATLIERTGAESGARQAA